MASVSGPTNVSHTISATLAGDKDDVVLPPEVDVCAADGAVDLADVADVALELDV